MSYLLHPINHQTLPNRPNKFESTMPMAIPCAQGLSPSSELEGLPGLGPPVLLSNTFSTLQPKCPLIISDVMYRPQSHRIGSPSLAMRCKLIRHCLPSPWQPISTYPSVSSFPFPQCMHIHNAPAKLTAILLLQKGICIPPLGPMPAVLFLA